MDGTNNIIHEVVLGMKMTQKYKINLDNTAPSILFMYITPNKGIIPLLGIIIYLWLLYTLDVKEIGMITRTGESYRLWCVCVCV